MVGNRCEKLWPEGGSQVALFGCDERADSKVDIHCLGSTPAHIDDRQKLENCFPNLFYLDSEVFGYAMT